MIDVADCSYCQQEMSAGVGCTERQYEIQFVDYARLTYEPDDDQPCHDCRVPPGTLHHPGCDDERCPKCGGQAIGCGCDDEEDE